MKELNIEQMEVINGGGSCFGEGAAFFGSALLSVCAIGTGVGALFSAIGWACTAYAYAQYFMCMYGNMG